MNSEIPNSDRLLRKKDVAALLACSMRTVERLVASGRLIRVKVRGAVRFRESQILSIINGATV